MLVKTVTEAKTQLSKLIEKALAGEEVVIGKAGKPLVKIVPCTGQGREAVPGTMKGEIKIAGDFDELPPDIAEVFGIIDAEE